AYQKQASDLEVACVRAVHAVAVFFERRARCVQCFRGPAQISRRERNFRLRNDALCARHRFILAEGARSATQELLRAREIAELRHRDAPECKRRCVVAQCDSVQCAERVARGKCARRGGDQRVHRNPVTLVTPTVSMCCARLVSRPITSRERRTESRFTLAMRNIDLDQTRRLQSHVYINAASHAYTTG